MKQVAIVTGGSRGIGAATALLLGKAGFTVAVNYRADRAAAEAVVKQVKSTGGHAAAMAADISIEADVVGLFEAVDHELGTVTALINNAGILATQARLDEMAVDRMTRVLTVNVVGSFICAREAVRRMSTRHGGAGGAIVNVSSVSARLGSAGEYIDYAASKGAIDSMTLGLAKEVAGEGIRVNAVRPGYIHTDIHASGGEPDRVNRLSPSIPMRRGGDPAEVAQAIAWLLSAEASYVTGTFIDLAGGV